MNRHHDERAAGLEVTVTPVLPDMRAHYERAASTEQRECHLEDRHMEP